MQIYFLMERHFIKGPNPTWNWPGRCIVGVECDWSETTRYRYYPNWPKQEYTEDRDITLEYLDYLLAEGKWAEVTIVDPDLIVDEGL